MEIVLLCVGKTDRTFWSDATEEYVKRLKHFTKFSVQFVADPKANKKTQHLEIKNEEAKKILQKIKPGDFVYLLDEKGKSFTSKGFAKQLEQHMISGSSRIIFIVGGAFGFSETLYQKFPRKIALSEMTFSHQMIRLFFCEQLIAKKDSVILLDDVMQHRYVKPSLMILTSTFETPYFSDRSQQISYFGSIFRSC